MKTSHADFLPLGVLVALALAAGRFLGPDWWMWALAGAVYAGCKWYTLARALRAGVKPSSPWRPWSYLLGWPGMDAARFLAMEQPPPPPGRAWGWAGAKTLLGAVLLWVVARRLGGGLLTGWVGMTGIVFLLHFGGFHLVALGWQRRGVDAPPLMCAPILAASLGEFWGRRWNSGFRDLAFGAGFARLRRRMGACRATMVIFLASGVIHDLVISLPARGGYGLPTAYFALQGAGLLAEHARGTAPNRWRGAWSGRCWTWCLVAGPAFWLFHPPFVRRVILPFMQTIHAL